MSNNRNMINTLYNSASYRYRTYRYLADKMMENGSSQAVTTVKSVSHTIQRNTNVAKKALERLPKTGLIDIRYDVSDRLWHARMTGLGRVKLSSVANQFVSKIIISPGADSVRLTDPFGYWEHADRIRFFEMDNDSDICIISRTERDPDRDASVLNIEHWNGNTFVASQYFKQIFTKYAHAHESRGVFVVPCLWYYGCMLIDKRNIVFDGQ